MRQINNININGLDIEFTELYYMDGSKLEVSDKDHSILVWYDQKESYEEWLYIKSSHDLYEKFISCKITLLEVIKHSDVFFTNRSYQTYFVLNFIEKIEKIESYKYMPAKDSYLAFDYAKERNETISDKLFSIESLSSLAQNFLSTRKTSSFYSVIEHTSIINKEPVDTLFDNWSLASSYKFDRVNVLPANDTNYKGEQLARK